MKTADNGRTAQLMDRILAQLERKRALAVAFSGGVDSSLVAALAHRALGPRALAITVDSPLTPTTDLHDAERTAEHIGIEHVVLELDELRIPGFSLNPPNRCYLCKTLRYRTLKSEASRRGFESVADGTSLTDLNDYRPGLAAARELGIDSPLLEAGLSKEDARAISGLLGLPTAGKASNSCLATRIPYGDSVDRAKLQRIDKAEASIRALTGAALLRVRDHGNLARIEVGQEEIELLSGSETRLQITESLKRLGYDFVALDLEGYRSGSFDDARRRNAR